MIPLINSFHVAMHLLSIRSQMMSKFVKSKHVTHEVQPSLLLVLSLYFVTWNLFVCYDKKAKCY